MPTTDKPGRDEQPGLRPDHDERYAEWPYDQAEQDTGFKGLRKASRWLQNAFAATLDMPTLLKPDMPDWPKARKVWRGIRWLDALTVIVIRHMAFIRQPQDNWQRTGIALYLFSLLGMLAAVIGAWYGAFFGTVLLAMFAALAFLLSVSTLQVHIENAVARARQDGYDNGVTDGRAKQKKDDEAKAKQQAHEPADDPPPHGNETGVDRWHPGRPS